MKGCIFMSDYIVAFSCKVIQFQSLWSVGRVHFFIDISTKRDIEATNVMGFRIKSVSGNANQNS